MPIRSWNGFSSPASRHSAWSSSHPPLHREGHVDARHGVLLDAPRLRVAEERQDRVADVLVDGGAVLEGDLRHLRQVVG